MLNCFGPPVYPDIVVDLPSFGQVNDSDLVGIVEAATNIWDQNHFDPSQASQWVNSDEQKDAMTWSTLISRDNRDAYYKAGYSEHLWLNQLRNFLKQKSDWSSYATKANPYSHPGWSLPKSTLFDPIHWRLFNDEGGPGRKDKGQNSMWGLGIVDGSQQAFDNQNDALYKQIQWAYGGSDGVGKAFGWSIDWSNQKASTDINIPSPPYPQLEGLGLTQFLEWLTGMDFFELFAWEYSVVLIIALVSIAWTDFFPFFKELGWVS